MLSRTLFTLVILMLVASFSYGDTLGVRGGIGYWNADFSGNIITNIPLDDDFDISSDSGLFAYVAFEHPIPLIPNIKVAYTNIEDSSTSTLNQSFDFKGISFAVDETIKTKIDLTHTDFTLYYELIDIGFDLDLGVTGRYFSGGLAINSLEQDFNTAVPMVYGSVRIGLPLSGLYFGAVANVGPYVYDFEAKIGWAAENFILPELGIEAGYRKFSLDADIHGLDINANVDTDGVFLALVAHF